MLKKLPDNITVTSEPAAPSAPPQMFNFAVPVKSMDAATREAYFLLRRKAKFGPVENYEAALPDGKTMTLAEVEAALGSKIKEARIPKKCC